MPNSFTMPAEWLKILAEAAEHPDRFYELRLTSPLGNVLRVKFSPKFSPSDYDFRVHLEYEDK